MTSSAKPHTLPAPVELERLTRALAALDAVMSPDWHNRYYSFNANWSDGERMASMRNGCGDLWNAVFCEAGVALIGLSHESPTFEPNTPKPWVFARLPAAFEENVRHEPAFDADNSTFCLWYTSEDGWCSGVDTPVEDGSDELLAILDGDPKTYVAFAAEYYEVELALEDVATFYEHGPLTPELLKRLNPEVDLTELQDELTQIGYPMLH